MFLFWGIFIFFLSLFFFICSLKFLMSMVIYLVEYTLVGMGGLEIKVFLLFDWMGFMFAAVVMFISSMVIVFSNDYMGSDKYKKYFLYGVLLFVGSMIFMIFGLNLLVILLGWDGLGLTSYCLVIYYQNSKSDCAGMITVLSNRVGDVLILLSIVMLINFGHLDLINLGKLMILPGFFLIIASMTKSAQIPFSAWLPAAMAAPTPVSSLVHSSTLVTAGVYLLIRLNNLFQVNFFSKYLLFFSLLTIIMAGMGAVLEMDLKKIIALSTLGQIGLMMLVLSVGMMNLSFFHLLTHAVFKAMLFLCAGIMIHNNMGNQDIRTMGLFFQINPLISGAFGLSSMALFGFPFLSGFYSKDLLLEYFYLMENSVFVLFLLVIATVLTCVYSLRLMYYVVWSGLLSKPVVVVSFSMFMGIPVVIMGFSVIFLGSCFMWIIFPEPNFFFLKFNLKCLNLWILLISFWLFFLCYFNSSGFEGKFIFAEFFSSLWFLSMVTSFFPLKTYKLSFKYSISELKWMEELGPIGLMKMNSSLSMIVQWLQYNNIFSFLLFMISFFVIFN
uniref:NADH-ubiquinone oxidoreductase chain 5 n=1 Tax=Argas sp. SpringbokSA-QMS95171 TaxID=1442167 RepID=W0FDG5_9ACAR|nr:NADH dehydrogenase subunit 5 [Argas sp. SpringbokSA-QMS95171]